MCIHYILCCNVGYMKFIKPHRYIEIGGPASHTCMGIMDAEWRPAISLLREYGEPKIYVWAEAPAHVSYPVPRKWWLVLMAKRTYTFSQRYLLLHIITCWPVCLGPRLLLYHFYLYELFAEDDDDDAFLYITTQHYIYLVVFFRSLLLMLFLLFLLFLSFLFSCSFWIIGASIFVCFLSAADSGFRFILAAQVLNRTKRTNTYCSQMHGMILIRGACDSGKHSGWMMHPWKRERHAYNCI